MPFANLAYEISSCVESEQTYLVSRSLIPVPFLICIELYAELFKGTSYLEGGRVICEDIVDKNEYLTIICLSQHYTHLDTCPKCHPYSITRVNIIFYIHTQQFTTVRSAIFTISTLAIKMNFTLLAQNMPWQSSVLKIIWPIL